MKTTTQPIKDKTDKQLQAFLKKLKEPKILAVLKRLAKK